MGHDLYALCDMDLLKRFGIDLDSFVKMAKAFDASIIQYRDKNASLQKKAENLKRLRKIWDKILIVNDEISLAKLCDGIHIGQEDLDRICEDFGAKSRFEGVILVKKLTGDRMVGLSCHDLEEIEEANSFDLDYIGLGAYRESRTKGVTRVLGERLPALAAHSKHKVVAIGGVRLFDQIDNVWLKAIGEDLLLKALTYA